MPNPPDFVAHKPHFHRNEAWKQPVRIATTAAGTLASSFENGDTVDGVALATGDRILVKDQAAPAENGIYTVEASGAPTRAYDMDVAAEVVGAIVYVVAGGDNAGTLWRVTNTATPTLGSTAINWDVVATGGGGANPEVVSTVAASGATETLDVSAASIHDVTLTADCTFTFTGAVVAEGWSFTLILRQDGTGGWDATWPGSVIWPGGTAPTLDTTASTASVLTFFTIDGGTSWFGFATGESGGGDPATTVEDETTFGITPAVGSDTEYARQDHTHGSPANPVTAAALEALGVRGELLVADGTTGPNGIVPTSYVEMSTPDSTTSASLEDITGASTTITLQRTSHIAAWLNTQISGSGVCVIGVAISLNGSDHDEVQHAIAGSDAAVLSVVHRTATELPPGTYTVKGRMRRVSGASTPSVDRADLLVMTMGASGPIMLTNEAEDDYLYANLA